MPSQTLRRLAGATAVALAFSATANAAGFIDTDRSVLTARVNVDNVIAQAAPNDQAPRLAARGFMQQLEAKLKEPAEGKTSFVDYPPRANAELLRLIAVVPPKGSEHLPIPVCAEQNNKVLGTWNITAKGDVLPAAWSGSMVSAAPNSSACKDFIMASRAEITRLAQSNQPAQPPPVSEQPTPPMKQAASAAGSPAL
ncbi:hypothetical protein [Zoogloea sp. 1C4]|jgi:hypothetical protein|uniref:hypothetical protein n=1 Tax=Zoogloea sp. 1C4 TaxID=2570190 RepID=UPI001290C8D6|nr:hypothetical protein [Zoogloea sp. 1C4]